MIPKPQFSLGYLVATPGALTTLAECGLTPNDILCRHESGDWGDVSEEDKRLNEQALRDGCRLFSAYMMACGVKLWVITEPDRSLTTVLLPEEY